jgi:hypothetical protein
VTVAEWVERAVDAWLATSQVPLDGAPGYLPTGGALVPAQRPPVPSLSELAEVAGRIAETPSLTRGLRRLATRVLRQRLELLDTLMVQPNARKVAPYETNGALSDKSLGEHTGDTAL